MEQISKVASTGEFLVGLLDGQIIAMGALKRTDQERAEIKRTRVHPGVQERGYDTLILQELERRAHTLGYRVLHLSTATILFPAQQFYRKLWFSGNRRTTDDRPLHGDLF